jgi:hypothetical protein
MKRLLKVGLFYSLLPFLCLAEDAGHIVSGQTFDSPLEKEMQKYDVNDSPYFGRLNVLENTDVSKDGETPHLQIEQADKIPSGIGTFDTGFTHPGTFDKTDHLIEYKYDELLAAFRGKAGYAFSFVYLLDNYSYDDQKGTFANTFDDGPDDINGGIFHLTMDRYFYRRGWVNLAWGVNMGFGYNSGKGVFSSDGVKSETTFKLWSLPLDVSITTEFPMGKWLKLGLTGGPSALGLIQNRDDRPADDPQKTRRQVGVGFFGVAKLKLSLSHFMQKRSLEMYQQYKLTNMLLNLEARYQGYSSFADNIEITGASFGLGLTFEFL